MTETMNDFMEKSLIPKMDEISAKNARQVVERMAHRALRPRTRHHRLERRAEEGLLRSRFRPSSAATEKALCVVKANEALIEEQDNRGGYFVATGSTRRRSCVSRHPSERS